MMTLRWLYFIGGVGGWIFIVFNVWHAMGWMFGAFLMAVAILSVSEWFNSTMLKQWKMRKVISYVDSYEEGER
jgi:hypothetical protein